MTIIAGPSVVNSATSGLIYYVDPGNSKSYSSGENLYPTSENWGLMLTSSTPSPYYQVSAGGPYGGAYYVTTVTNTVSSNYWFEWGNTVSLNAGDVVTQTYHIRPITTSAGTLQTVGLQFWNGAGRAWTTYRYTSFTLGTTASVYYTSGGTSTASISLLDNGWYRISQTATADQAGYSGMSLYVSGNIGFNTGTIYHFAAAQIEKNGGFTAYTPTYGTAVSKSLTVSDLTKTQSTASTITNVPSFTNTNGGGLVFTTASNGAYITTPIRGDTTFTSSSTFTISAWFKATDYVSASTGNWAGTIVGCFSFDGYGLAWQNATTSTMLITAQMRTKGGGPLQAYPYLTLSYYANLNTWYHYAFTYDYTNLVANLYVNGVNQGTAAIPASTNTGTYSNIVGQAISLATPYSPAGPGGAGLPGVLGPSMIYNRALTSSEVQQLFNAHRGRYGV
jgi:hypothetical protein